MRSILFYGENMEIILWALGNHAIKKDYGYLPTERCGADSTAMYTRAWDENYGDKYICENGIKFWLHCPVGAYNAVIEWENSEAAKKGLFMGVMAYDEPELHNVSPDEVARHISKIKELTSRPVWLNSFVSLKIYEKNSGKKFPKSVNLRVSIDSDIVKWDALDYANCGQDRWTFDCYYAMGTPNCSWLSSRADLIPQLRAFLEACPKNVLLGVILQAFDFNKCGVPNITLDDFKWNYQTIKREWGDKWWGYIHYAFEDVPSEGVFPPVNERMRNNMLEFNKWVNSGVSVFPITVSESKVLLKVGDKYPIHLSFPDGVAIDSITISSDCIEGWPKEIINQTGFATINGIKAGAGSITLAATNGTQTVINYDVVEDAAVVNEQFITIAGKKYRVVISITPA